MAGPQPPLFEVTSTNHAAWVVAVTISFLVYSIAGVLIKLFYRLRLTNPKSYDWCLISAVLCVFIHSVLVVRACVHGLGKHQTILSDTSLLSFNKVCYHQSRTETH